MTRFIPNVKKHDHFKKIEAYDEKFEKSYFKEFNKVSDSRIFTDYQVN